MVPTHSPFTGGTPAPLTSVLERDARRFHNCASMRANKSIPFGTGIFALVVVLPVLLVMLLLPGASEHTFSSGYFMPHIHCYLDNPRVVWLHVLSDFFIGAAYVAISSTLA